MTWTPERSGKRGRQQIYSDAAIKTCLTMKILFGMALRQTGRFVESLTLPKFHVLDAYFYGYHPLIARSFNSNDEFAALATVTSNFFSVSTLWFEPPVFQTGVL